MNDKVQHNFIKNHKDKIISFMIGLLIGAVISAGSFVAYLLVTNSNHEKHEFSTPPAMMEAPDAPNEQATPEEQNESSTTNPTDSAETPADNGAPSESSAPTDANASESTDNPGNNNNPKNNKSKKPTTN